MKAKKLTATMVNAAISGMRFAFGTTANITKAGLDMSTDIAGFISGVNMPNRIGDTVWACGQEATTGMMNLLQKGVRYWGDH